MAISPSSGLLVFGIVGSSRARRIPPDQLRISDLSRRSASNSRVCQRAGREQRVLASRCSYIIGRTLGWKAPALRAPGGCCAFATSQIQWVHDWFNRIGHWALMIGYFVPGVRHFTAIVAGTSKLEYHGFAGPSAYARCAAVGEHISISRISFQTPLGRECCAWWNAT